MTDNNKRVNIKIHLAKGDPLKALFKLPVEIDDCLRYDILGYSETFFSPAEKDGVFKEKDYRVYTDIQIPDDTYKEITEGIKKRFERSKRFRHGWKIPYEVKPEDLKKVETLLSGIKGVELEVCK